MTGFFSNLVNVAKVPFFYSHFSHNNIIGTYVGKDRAKLPYSKIEEYGIVIHGLPDDKGLKHPSSYGKNYLQKLLKNKDELRLTGIATLI